VQNAIIAETAEEKASQRPQRKYCLCGIEYELVKK
jgi:hypothetical protein